MKYALLAICLLTFSAMALAEENQSLDCGYTPKKTQDNPNPEFQVYTDCLDKDSLGAFRMRGHHFKALDFSEQQFIGILIEKDRWGYINRNNKIIVMLAFDNGPDYFSEGLARTVDNGKIGFVNEALDVVIPPQFDAAFPFENNRAKVGRQCATIQDGEHRLWECRQWFEIDKTGKRIDGSLR
jgi:hypothetical protein